MTDPIPQGRPLTVDPVRQCKDIPDRPILELLLKLNGKWATWGAGYSMPTVSDAMPPLPNQKLALAKMRQMIRRGVVSGCDCGCRGDFVITDKGRAELTSP